MSKCTNKDKNFSKEGFEKLSKQNPLKNLGLQAISHLKPEHIDYVMKWTAFLQLENSIDNSKDNLTAKTSDIWTLSIDERCVLLFQIIFFCIIIFYVYYYFLLYLIYF